ncbi:MAG: outer membrane beta-barrel protein, partial [bacterium]|nr:outer membrane beta-barrel protein [bacterium]
MRPLSLTKFIRQTTLLLLSLLITAVSYSQEAANKWSASVALGVPVTFFSIKSKPVGIYTGGVRYSFNKTWSLEARLTANTFYNNATGNKAKATLDGTSSDVISYRTPVYGLNGIVYYNLHNIFGLNKFPESKWLPYATLGAGYNMYKPS